MRSLHLAGVSKAEIGRMFNVTRETVRKRVGNGVVRYSLVGMRFGRLLVLSEDPARTAMTECACECDCGRRATTLRQSLVHGHARSCGCLQRENQRRGRPR